MQSVMRKLANTRKKQPSRLARLILFALGLGTLFWLLDSLAHAYLFRGGELIDQIFTLDASMIWPRLLVLGFLIGFAFHSNYLLGKRQRVEEEIRQRNRELAALNAIAESVNQSDDLSQILQNALEEVLNLKILGDQAFGMLFLLDQSSQILRLAAQRGAPEDHPCLICPPKVGECLCGQALLTGEVLIAHNSLEDQRHSRHWPSASPHKDICVPIKARGIALGVLEIRLPLSCAISENDIGVLKAVTDQIGVGIENAELRELRERAIVEERERIARELHDGLAQVLGYVNTKAMAVRLLLEKNQVQTAEQHLLQLEEAARNLFVDVRGAILNLKMAEQSGASLTANLDEFCTQFSRLNGMPVKLSIKPEVKTIPLAAETQYQLLRIVQEALNNIRKHASATHAYVSLGKDSEALELTVADDGNGFDMDSIPAVEEMHFGLSNMRGRAEAIGAELQIVSAPGKGTRLLARLNVREG